MSESTETTDSAKPDETVNETNVDTVANDPELVTPPSEAVANETGLVTLPSEAVANETGLVTLPSEDSGSHVTPKSSPRTSRASSSASSSASSQEGRSVKSPKADNSEKPIRSSKEDNSKGGLQNEANAEPTTTAENDQKHSGDAPKIVPLHELKTAKSLKKTLKALKNMERSEAEKIMKATNWTTVKFMLDKGPPTKGKQQIINAVKDAQVAFQIYGENFVESKADMLQKKKSFQKEKINLKDKWLLSQTKKYIDKFAQPFSYQDGLYSLSTSRVRQRLSDLMGSDVIRLNDKHYFERLSERLQQEYETVMDKQEESRAATESQRLRRLMLEGIVDNPSDYRTVVHDQHKPRTVKKKKRRQHIRRVDYVRVESAQTYTYRNYDEEKSRQEDVETQVGVMSRPVSTRLSSQDTPTQQRTGSVRNNTDRRSFNNMYEIPPHHPKKTRLVKSASPRLQSWDDKGTFPVISEKTTSTTTSWKSFESPTSSPDYRSLNRRPSKYTTREPERITQLRREETVEGLYAMAEDLVPVKNPDAPVENREKVDHSTVKMKRMK